MMTNYTKIVKNFTKLQITLIIMEILLVIAICYVNSNPESALYSFRFYLSVIAILFGCLCIYTTHKYNILSREMGKYSNMVRVVDNIVRVTAMNYFYANRMKKKFDIDKISKLDKSEFQFAYVPDMLDLESEATEEEIKASIEYMKDWNIGVLHSLLTHCINTKYISGEARRILIKHFLAGINNINDESFVYQKTEDGKEFYRMSLQWEEGTERYS